MTKIKIPEYISKIINMLESEGFEAFAVGGCIRDSLIGRVPSDWDVTTSAKPTEIKRIFKRTIDTGIEHGTVTVLMDHKAVEVTTYRIDGEYKDLRHPSSVEYTSDIKEDLRRRDFTINAIAYNEEIGIVDPFDGRGDLRKKLIRCVGDPLERLTEDALRIFRAVRFCAQLGFKIDEDTKDAIKKLSSNLSNISAERISAELIKTITSPRPETMVTAYNLGITKVILPEFDDMMECTQNSIHHNCSVGEHTIKTMMNVPDSRILRLTMLFHDIGKPLVKATDVNGTDHFKNHAFYSVQMAHDIMKRLRLDNDTIKTVMTLVKYHDWRLYPTEENVRRLVSEIGHPLMEYFFLVQRADLAGKSEYRHDKKKERIDDTQRVYETIKARGDCTSLAALAITGRDLLDIGMKKGPEIGIILNKALDNVIAEPSHNTKEYLIRFAKNFL